MAIKVSGTTVIDSSRNADVNTLSIAGTQVTATAAELNILDGLTVTTAELNNVTGINSSVQTQLDEKLTAANNLSDLTNTATARTNLGVAVGTDVLAYDANLQGFVDAFTLPTVDGTAGQVLATDGAGNLALASAGGSNFTATASGSISNGKAVVVNSDATVSEISGTSVSSSLGPSSGPVQSNDNLTDADITYDPNTQRLFLAYRDNSSAGNGFGYARVGTITGNSISFGAGSRFEGGNRTDTMTTIFDPSTQKTLLFHGFGSFSSISLSGRVVTISGSSYSVGAKANITSNNGSKVRSAAYDSTNEKVIISYDAVDRFPAARVCTVSGTSLGYGPEAIAESAAGFSINVVYDSVNQKVVLLYSNSSNFLTVVVGTVSGTSITFGAPVRETSYTVSAISATFDPESGKILVVTNTGSPAVGHALTVTVSGNFATFSVPVAFTGFFGPNISSVYDPASKKIIIALKNDTDPNDRGEIFSAKIVGDTVLLDAPEIFNTTGVTDVDLTFDTTGGQSVIVSRSVNQQLSARTFTSKNVITNLTEENFVGFSEGSYSSGQSATIQVVGSVEDSQTGLTAGKEHYVKFDGSLTTSSTPNTADEIQTYAGISLSPTELLVKG